MAEPVGASAHVVGQELACRRDRRRHPGLRGWPGRGGGEVEKRAEGRHADHPVGHGVMHSQEQADLPLRQAGQEPYLPYRACGIQPPSAQLLTRQQKLGVVAGRGQREDPDMVGELKRCSVGP